MAFLGLKPGTSDSSMIWIFCSSVKRFLLGVMEDILMLTDGKIDAKRGKSDAKRRESKYFSGKQSIFSKKSQKITHFYLKKAIFLQKIFYYIERRKFAIFYYIYCILLHKNPVTTKSSTISRVSTISDSTISRVDCTCILKTFTPLRALWSTLKQQFEALQSALKHFGDL